MTPKIVCARAERIKEEGERMKNRASNRTFIIPPSAFILFCNLATQRDLFTMIYPILTLSLPEKFEALVAVGIILMRTVKEPLAVLSAFTIHAAFCGLGALPSSIMPTALTSTILPVCV